MNPILIQILWVILFWAGFVIIALPELFKKHKRFYEATSRWMPALGIAIINIAVILAPFGPQPRISGALELPSRVVGIILTIWRLSFMMISGKSLSRKGDLKTDMKANKLVTT